MTKNAQRRRAQNRASQRAFRERKERHLRNLKQHLESLIEKHRTLLSSYAQQTDVLVHLQQRMAELNAELKKIYSERDFSNVAFDHSMLCPGGFDKFDAFPSSSGSRLGEHQTQPQRPHFDENRSNLAGLPELGHLPGFEDLLNMH